MKPESQKECEAVFRREEGADALPVCVRGMNLVCRWVFAYPKIQARFPSPAGKGLKSGGWSRADSWTRSSPRGPRSSATRDILSVFPRHRFSRIPEAHKATRCSQR